LHNIWHKDATRPRGDANVTKNRTGVNSNDVITSTTDNCKMAFSLDVVGSVSDDYNFQFNID